MIARLTVDGLVTSEPKVSEQRSESGKPCVVFNFTHIIKGEQVNFVTRCFGKAGEFATRHLKKGGYATISGRISGTDILRINREDVPVVRLVLTDLSIPPRPPDKPRRAEHPRKAQQRQGGK